MKDKNASRFFSIQLAILSIVLLACAIAWPVAHLVKGTLNVPSSIYAIAMLAGALHLSRLSWKDVRDSFRKESNQK